MPYNPASAQGPITVASWSITLYPETDYVLAGQTLKLSGYLKYDTTGAVGETVEIYIYLDPEATYYKIATVTTQSGGYFSYTWTVPWKVSNTTLPCSGWRFRAYHPASGTGTITDRVYVIYPTRIRDFSVPSTVAAGQTFKVSGYLEYQKDEATWAGLANRTVGIYLDNTSLGQATTGSDGRFELDCVINTPGTYTVSARFAGEGLALAAVTAEQVIASLQALYEYASYALAFLPVVVPACTILVNELRRKR